jgi:two-component system CheB/CheR fusion protein
VSKVRTDADHGLDKLVNTIKEHFGTDLSGYKQTVLSRQVHSRMRLLGLFDFEDYADYLKLHADEHSVFLELLHTGVTDFFRDPGEWDFLSQEIVPAILEEHGSEPIRIWCVGCSTGQEAYSLAMVFANALGLDDLSNRLCIFATDINESALNKAMSGSYCARDVGSIEQRDLDNYFNDSVPGLYTIRAEIKQAITFFKHDIVHEAALKDIDLISFRNTLIYLNEKTQVQVLKRLYGAVGDTGFLFLGRMESPKNSMFEHVNHRPIFRKEKHRQLDLGSGALPWDTEKILLVRRTFELSPCAQLICSANMVLIAANQSARKLFGLRAPDCGTVLNKLALGQKAPALIAELASLRSHPRTSNLPIDWTEREGQNKALSADIVPIFRIPQVLAGFTVTVHHRACHTSEAACARTEVN